MTENPSPTAANRDIATLSLPWKTRLQIAVLSAVTDFARRSDGTINRRLLSCFDLRAPASANPLSGVRTADIPVTVDPPRDLWFRLFVPADAADGESLPVIVFLHGGGFVFLSAASRVYDAVCPRICRQVRAIVLSVNYRLAPEHRWPALYDDGEAVLHFLDLGDLASADPDAGELANLSSCVLAGGSAEGNITHHVARRWAAGADNGAWERARLVGMVLIQPFFGGRDRTEAERLLERLPIISVERMDWLWRALLPEGSDRDHKAVNVFGPREAEAGELEAALPEALVIVGGFDPLVDWQRRYYDGLRERESAARLVEYREAIHAFHLFPQLQDSELAINEIKTFVDTH